MNTRLVIVGSLVAALAAAALGAGARGSSQRSRRHSTPRRPRCRLARRGVASDRARGELLVRELNRSPSKFAEEHPSTSTSPQPHLHSGAESRDWRASRLRSRRTRSSSSSCLRSNQRRSRRSSTSRSVRSCTVVAGPKVPIGLYTREVLKRLASSWKVLRKTASSPT